MSPYLIIIIVALLATYWFILDYFDKKRLDKMDNVIVEMEKLGAEIEKTAGVIEKFNKRD